MNDVVTISTLFARTFIGRFLNRTIEKKVGFDPKIKLVRFNFENGKTVHADLSLDMPPEEFEKLMGVIFDEQ